MPNEPRPPSPTPEVVDVEEDRFESGWVVTPTESCTFVALGVFATKRDAEAFREVLRERAPKSKYDDLAVLPAKALVLVANSFDVKAGREALAKVDL